MKFFSFVDKFTVGSGNQLVFAFIGWILFEIFEVTLMADFDDFGGLGDRIGGKTSGVLSLCLLFVSYIDIDMIYKYVKIFSVNVDGVDNNKKHNARLQSFL